MIKKLRKYLLKHHDYELEEYALYKPEKHTHIVIKIFYVLFVIATVLFVLDEFFEVISFMSLGLYLYSFFLFILVPIGWVKKQGKYAIVVTDRFLIQWNGTKQFTVMNYNNITAFKLIDEGVRIREHRHEIILSTDLYKEQIEPIIEILEAYGKTFDMSKKHMIRPIQIQIKDNIVKVIDIEEHSDSDSDVFNEYIDNYPSLTPGFLDQLTFRNSILTNANVKNQNLIVNLASLIVREDHPENTTFGQLEAKDCVVILEHFKLTYVDVDGFEDFNGKDVYELVKASKNSTTITRVEHGEHQLKVSFSFGVQKCVLNIEFDQVYVGWKSQSRVK